MTPRVLAHFAVNGGMIRRATALDLGVSPTQITAALQKEDWVVGHRGVYIDGEVWRAADPWHGQPLLRAMAAVLAMRRSWILSHDSAVHAHRMAWWRPAKEFVHVTRDGHTNAWTQGTVKHHLARYREEQALKRDGIPVLDMARTACDVAREHGFDQGLIVADSALHHGVPRSALEEAAARMAFWPNVTVVRDVIDLADGGAMNGAESLARKLVIELGIGRPETQFPYWLSTRHTAWADIRVGRHVFEFHGEIKFLPVELGGFGQVKPTRVAFEERKRERLTHEAGLGTSAIYVDDLFGTGRDLAKVRLRAEWDETVARFGTELPEHMVRNALEIRSRMRPPGVA